MPIWARWVLALYMIGFAEGAETVDVGRAGGSHRG